MYIYTQYAAIGHAPTMSTYVNTNYILQLLVCIIVNIVHYTMKQIMDIDIHYTIIIIHIVYIEHV